MEKLDAWLVAALEKRCRWFQLRTGKTHFALMGICLAILGAGMLSVGLGFVSISEILAVRNIKIFFIFLGVLFFALALGMIPLERYTDERVAQKIPNTQKELHLVRLAAIVISLGFAVRWCFLLLSMSDHPHFLFETGFITFLFFLYTFCKYLFACDPLSEKEVKAGKLGNK